MILDHSRDGIVVLSSIMIVVALASIALRFWSRTVVLRGQYRLDDWLALVALVPTIALLCIGLTLVYAGAGKPKEEVSPQQMTKCFKLFFAGSIFFDLSMAFAKFSALAFYNRVFGIGRNPSQQWTILYVMALGVTSAWLAMALLYGIFRCKPVSKAWYPLPSTPGECASFDTYMLAMAAVNVFADVVIVLLPIPQILALKLPARSKFGVVFLLLVGYCVPLVSIGRVVTVVQLKPKFSNDPTYYLVTLGFWLLAEPPISLLAISLPACFQLCMRAWKYGWHALFTTRDYELRPGRRLAGYRYPADLEGTVFHNLSYGVLRSNRKHFVSIARGTAKSDKSSSSTSVPKPDDLSIRGLSPLREPDLIHVKTDITVTYNT